MAQNLVLQAKVDRYGAYLAISKNQGNYDFFLTC